MMREDDPRLAMIRANADMVIAEFGPLSGLDFAYDRSSVAWLSSYIDLQRSRLLSSDDAEKLVSVLGCYLGEAIIRRAGGAWDVHERDEIGVCFGSGDWCFPFSKVAKHVAHGAESGQSILAFYDACVGLIASGQIVPGREDEAA